MKYLTMTDWAILYFLYTREYNSRLRGAKLTDFDIDKKPNSLYKRLMALCKAGYVCKGMSEGYLHTYFITAEGVEFLADDIGEEEEIEQDE